MRSPFLAIEQLISPFFIYGNDQLTINKISQTTIDEIEKFIVMYNPSWQDEFLKFKSKILSHDIHQRNLIIPVEELGTHAQHLYSIILDKTTPELISITKNDTHKEEVIQKWLEHSIDTDKTLKAEEEKMRQVLNHRGFEMSKNHTTRGGNCQFEAISDQIYGTINYH